MSLATILVVCVLIASSSTGGADSSTAPVMAQENQPEQESPQTTSPPETSKPPEQTQPEQTEPEPSSAPSQTQAPSAQPENPQPDAAAKKPAAATAPKKHRRKRKPAARPGSGPTKTVVPNGSTPDSKGQIAPSLTEEQASHQRQNTTQLLASTDANLKKLSGRQLSPSQQDMVKQTQTYMEQAKAAEAAGDLQRARNLAFKAHLLSDELVKH